MPLDPPHHPSRPRRAGWLGMLGLPLCFAASSLAWLNLSDTLLRIAAPDAEMMPLLRALNYFVFVALSTLAWSGWVLRERATHRRRETLSRTLLEQAPTPLALARRGRVVACNPAFARLLGVPDPEAGRGEALLTHVPPDARAPLLDHIRELDARAPRTTRIDTTVTDRQGGRQALALLLRRFRTGRESMDVVACLPPDPVGDALSVRDDLGLQLLERLPRPVWIWTPHGLCLWRNAAAGENNQAATRAVRERYGNWHEGSRLPPAAVRELLQPALTTGTAVCITVPSTSTPAPIPLRILPIPDRQGHVQAVAAVVDTPAMPEGYATPESTLLRSLEVALQQAVTQPTPDGRARALLEGLQRHIYTESWVALLQVDRAARQASFWSLTSLGMLDRTTLTLTPDVPTECGPSGKADIATLTRLESLPAILAQMERAGIDRFERILPEHTGTDPMQTLMVAGPARCATPLSRCWMNVTFSLAALLLRAPQMDGSQRESQRARG